MILKSIKVNEQILYRGVSNVLRTACLERLNDRLSEIQALTRTAGQQDARPVGVVREVYSGAPVADRDRRDSLCLAKLAHPTFFGCTGQTYIEIIFGEPTSVKSVNWPAGI